MEKFNCWTFKKCGLEPGGSKISKYGVCPAAVKESLYKINSGENAGRVCWAVKNTPCDSMKHDNYAKKSKSVLDVHYVDWLKCRGKIHSRGLKSFSTKTGFDNPFVYP